MGRVPDPGMDDPFEDNRKWICISFLSKKPSRWQPWKLVFPTQITELPQEEDNTSFHQREWEFSTELFWIWKTKQVQGIFFFTWLVEVPNPLQLGKRFPHRNTIWIVHLRTPPFRDNSTELKEKSTQASVWNKLEGIKKNIEMTQFSLLTRVDTHL